MGVSKNTLPAGSAAYGDGGVTAGLFYQIVSTDEVDSIVANTPHQHLGVRDDILKSTQDEIIDEITNVLSGTNMVADSEADHTTSKSSLEDLFRVSINADGTLKAGAVNRAIPGHIGTPGRAGFGVGVCPEESLQYGIIPMPGYDDPRHPNYGNYLHILDSSVMVFIPTFFYKIESDRIRVKGFDPTGEVEGTYATWDAALDDGYTLHRAFLDFNRVATGVFVDKYINSARRLSFRYTLDNSGKAPVLDEDIFTVPSSLPYEAPTSVSATSEWSATSTNQNYNVFEIAHSRDNVFGKHVDAGSSLFAPCTIFVYSALAMLSLAHGRAAILDGYGATACAWYDGSDLMNFPKGANFSQVDPIHGKDINDNTLSYVSYGTGSAYNIARTGLARTTHNGQVCGVCDINGLGEEYAVALTNCKDSGTTEWYAFSHRYQVRSIVGTGGTSCDQFADRSELQNKWVNVTMPGASGYFAGGTEWLCWQASSGQDISDILDPTLTPFSNGWLLTQFGFPKDANALFTEPAESASSRKATPIMESGMVFGGDLFYVPASVDHNAIITVGGKKDYGRWAGMWCRSAVAASAQSGAASCFRCITYPLGGSLPLAGQLASYSG
jgi:hypothetical protein